MPPTKNEPNNEKAKDPEGAVHSNIALEAVALDKMDEARALKERNCYKEAVPLLEDALKTMDRTDSSKERRLQALIDLSFCHMRLGDFNKSFSNAKLAYEMIGTPGLPINLKGEALLEYGISLNDIGNPEEALKQIGRALSIFENAKNEKGITRACICLGNIFFRTHVHGKALAYYNRAIKMSESRGNYMSVMGVKQNVAMIKFDQGFISDAEKDFKSIVESTRKKDMLMLHNYVATNLARVYVHTGRWDDTISISEEVRELSNKLGNKRQSAIVTSYMAEAHVMKGDIEKAERLLDENNDTVIGTGDFMTEAYALRARAILNQEKGEFQKAYEAFRDAANTLTKVNARSELALIYIDWAKALCKEGNTSQAKVMFGKAKSIYKELQFSVREKALDGLMREKLETKRD